MQLGRLILALWFVAVAVHTDVRAQTDERSTVDSAQALLKDLKATNVDMRRSAALKIRTASRPLQLQALPDLIERLEKENDGQVRLAVFDTITALGPQASAAVPALVQTLKTDVGGKGEEALHQDFRSALALAAIGKPAVEALRELLKQPKASVRAEVVMSLGRIGPDAAAAVPDLIPLLADKNDRIRREAIVALGHLGPAAVEPLIAVTRRTDAVQVAGAVESLGYLCRTNESAGPAILARAKDPAPMVRTAVLNALAQCSLSADLVLPVVNDGLRDQNDTIRLAAVNWLVGRPALLARVAPELESLLTAKSDGVARHAAFLLGKLGVTAVPRLIAALPQPGSRIVQIAEAFVIVGRPATADLAIALGASNSRVRRAAALALGQIRPMASGTVQKLAAGLADPDLAVRGDFLTGIGYLGPRSRECLPAVRNLLHDPSAAIRVRAIQILFESAPRDERLLNDLITLIDDPDPTVQRQSITIVRAIGPTGARALSSVVKKLASPSDEVRLAAAEFIGTHGQAATSAIPALTALLEIPSPQLRMTAAQALGKIGKPAQTALPRLTTLLDAEQPEVREAALTALASLELDVDVARPHIAKALRDKKPEIRRAAARAIQRFGPQGAIFVPDIILLAESKDNARSVERMLRRFERDGPDPRSVPELVKQLDHDQAAVRLLAIRFLALAGPRAREAIPALDKMSKDPIPEVRKQAEAASKRIMKNTATS